ncbi:DUF4352 domain-containing protein [Alkalicoccobacillus murimartini]|uniref:DUF4352 domain-containing protein n=1 Tax=Alkalicoccobacillus murimartini TaxID=171685 RepID=A0ABT9YEU9_9BACI|nr:DUF4352 domain-containing protein [Alkalicoccobacillus murimartini]MDQ0206376.1 hypothetical protein [Alkalicoccobacillus murimartini]
MKKVFKFGCLPIIILIVLIAIIAAITGGDDSNSSSTTSEANADESNQNDSDESNEEESTEDVEETVKMGEPLDVNDIIFTVSDLTTSDTIGNDFINETAKGEFLLLSVSVENTRSEKLTMSSDYFKLIAGGATYESDVTYSIYLEDDSIIYEDINPGLTLNGVVPFDVPPGLDLSDAVIQVQTGVFGTETGEIDIAQ